MGGWRFDFDWMGWDRVVVMAVMLVVVMVLDLASSFSLSFSLALRQSSCNGNGRVYGHRMIYEIDKENGGRFDKCSNSTNRMFFFLTSRDGQGDRQRKGDQKKENLHFQAGTY